MEIMSERARGPSDVKMRIWHSGEQLERPTGAERPSSNKNAPPHRRFLFEYAKKERGKTLFRLYGAKNYPADAKTRRRSWRRHVGERISQDVYHARKKRAAFYGCARKLLLH
jgi:hypothetical protein